MSLNGLNQMSAGISAALLTAGEVPVARLYGTAITPDKHGRKYWSWPNGACTSGSAQTSGTPQLNRIETQTPFTCANVITAIGNAPTLIIGGQNCLALYDSTGAALYRSSTYAVTTIGGVGGAYIVNDALTQASTSGAGTGFTATVKTLSGNGVGTLTTTAAGSGYANGDTITLTNAHGGTGAVLTVVVDNGSYQLIDTSLTAAGIISVATGGVAVSTAFVWAAFLSNFTGTAPQLQYTGLAFTALVNDGLITATANSATWGSSKTVLATGFTPSSALTQAGRIHWFALS